MDKVTLQGTKRQVYALLKVLKYCTGSPTKSYECKFALHLALQKEPKSDKIGEAICEVINNRIIRGKFNSVHKDLKNLV